MAQGKRSHLLQYIRRLAATPPDDLLTDRQLLQGFIDRQEEAAFAELLCRHGPMVLGVCRRLLCHEQDAEDAFQACFLVLAQKAASIRGPDALANWLRRVAYHIATAARARAARRRVVERRAAVMQPAGSQPAGSERRWMLDEELNCLPRKYQAPLVLCYLEGKTHDEAARELRWPVGTVKGRLARARDMLRRRLIRRGLTLTTALTGALVPDKTAEAVVPAALVQSTLKAAALCVAGAAAAGVLPAQVVAFIKGGTKAMVLTKVPIGASLLLAVGLLATGAGIVTRQVLAASAGATPATAQAADSPAPVGKEAPDGRELATLTGHAGSVLAMAYSPRAGLFATASADKTVRLWDAATRKQVAVLQGHTAEVVAVAISADGRVVASAGADKTVKLWDLATRKERASLPHPDVATSVAFTPDGNLLATGGKDNALRFWDVASGQIDRRLQVHQEPITAVAFSPDGKTLVEGSADRTVTVWVLERGERLSQTEAHAGAVTSLAVSPDGKTIASASADKTVKLLELATGKELATLTGHAGAVLVVAFDPAGKRLATAGADKTVRIWDEATGKELARLEGHSGEVTALAFGPHGQIVFTGSADKTVKVWDVSSRGGQPDIEAAHALFEAGKFAEAEKLYARIATRDPRQYAAIVRLGRIALLSNRLDESQKWLERARDLKPAEAEPKALLAEVWYRRDDFQRAAPLLRAVGQEARAKKLASFQDLTPYQVQGPQPSTSLQFVTTDPLPLVRVRINGGKEVNFLLDTGAGELSLDADFAREVGIKSLGAEQGTFAGGRTAAVHHGRIDSLTLGDWIVRNVPVMLLRTRHLSGPLFGGKQQVDGVIGTVLLYHFLSTLDYPKGELILRRKQTASHRQSGGAAAGQIADVPFWLAGDHTVVAWGRINKREPVLFFIDTGLAGGSVALAGSVLKEAGIKLLEGEAADHIGGGGKVRSIPFTLKELQLGEATGQDLRGWFDGPLPCEHAHGFRIAGLVSHGFFRPYSLTFDFTAMRLILAKTP
jgi:RNA polymerase sigma factor (sigma-70 family)